VFLDGARRDPQPLGDRRVGHAGGDELEDLRLASGEAVQVVGLGSPRGAAQLGHLVDAA
jgi:hypothetical protein